MWKKDGSIFLAIHAKPGSKQSCITDVSNTQIAVQISAPAQDGEANVELIRTIASIVGVRKSSVSIEHGHRSREKRVKITELDKEPSEVLSLLHSNVKSCV